MWLNPAGQEMNDDEWGTHFVKTLGVLLNGDAHRCARLARQPDH